MALMFLIQTDPKPLKLMICIRSRVDLNKPIMLGFYLKIGYDHNYNIPLDLPVTNMCHFI